MQKSARIKNPRIIVESIGEFTETHNIAYGIVAYSFVSRYSCLEFNCVSVQYSLGTVAQYSYEYSLRFVSDLPNVTIKYSLRNTRQQPSGQVRSRQAVRVEGANP